MAACLCVSDVAASVAFYASLGLQCSARSGWVRLGEQALLLVGGAPAPSAAGAGKPWDVLFKVGNAQEHLRELKQKVRGLFRDATISRNRTAGLAYFTAEDPDGYTVAFGSKLAQAPLTPGQVLLHFARAHAASESLPRLTDDVVELVEQYLGAKDSALRFAGEGVVMLQSDCGLSNRTAFTISVLVRFANFNASYPGLVSDRANNISFHGLGPAYPRHQQRRTTFYLSELPDRQCLSTAVPLTPGEWHFVTIGYDAGLQYSYVDGRHRAEVRLGDYAGPIARVQEMMIGCCGSMSPDQYLSGDVAWVAIWDRAVTDPAEMCSLALTGREPGLLALYRFDDPDAPDGAEGDQPTVLRDASPHGRHGRIRGAQWVRCPDLRHYAPLR